MSQLMQNVQYSGAKVSSSRTPIICSICKRDNGHYSLSCVPSSDSTIPFFPFLEILSVATTGRVNVCNKCGQSLLDQWDHFEVNHVPITNRVYYLPQKIIPVQLSDNAKHSIDTIATAVERTPENGDEVLDLSVPSNSNHNVKYWTPNRAPQICYVCGDDNSYDISRPINNCPYFPSLLSHPKPPLAKPMDSNGRICICESCHRYLLNQWEYFQRSNIPISERNYNLNRPSISSEINRNYSCVLCNFEINMRTVAISLITMHDESSAMKKLVLSSAREIILTIGTVIEPERVITCVSCFKRLTKYDDNCQSPQSKRKFTNDQNCINCIICHRDAQQLLLIDTNPHKGGRYFFPFLKDLAKHNEMDSNGRVRICNVCFSSLESQWDAYESAFVPHSQREYRLYHHKQRSPPPLKIQVSSPPPLQQSSLNSEPLLTTVTTPTHNNYCTTQVMTPSISVGDSNSDVPIVGPIDSLVSSFGSPINVSTTCQVCGDTSIAGQTYQIFASPKERLSHDFGIFPFFPFLQRLLKSDERDFRSFALVCSICYHSLIGQWIAYESSPFPEDKDPLKRTYNCNDYICYICGVTTYRKRVRSITVKDFPFLLEHPRPPGALTLCNGETVVTCLTCFDSLTLQWRDYERMKVPIEMRKYNWITLPPPPELSANEDPLPLVRSGYTCISGSLSSPSNSTAQGLGLTSHKPQVLNATNTSLSTATKSPSGVQRNMAAVSPLYQVPGATVTMGNVPAAHPGMSNSALAATRTSSFAAALRKLAKQAFDPGNGPDNGQGNAMGMSNASGSKGNSSSSYQNPYQTSLVPPSPPIVTIAPIPAHQIERKSDGHTLLFDHRIATEQSKESLHYSHAQRSSPIVQVRPSPSHEHDSGANANHNSLNRSAGFQPYRSSYEDSLRSNPSSSLTGTPLSSHLMPYADTLTYPYHPFLPPPHQIVSQSGLTHHVASSSTYRLDDPFYIDRFGLLRNTLHGNVPSSMGHATSSGASSVPFNLARYSELLNSHHERIINDERQRLLNQSHAQSTYKSASSIDSPPAHHSSSLANDRRAETNSGEHHMTNHPLHSNLLLGKRDFSSGSILSGTPRDVPQLSTQSITRKSHVAPLSASVKPLNLSSTSEHSTAEHSYLWRPQTEDIRDHITNDQFKNRTNHVQEQSIDDSKSQHLILNDPLKAKRQRLNNYPIVESANNVISNGFNNESHDKSTVSSSKSSASSASSDNKVEGLQSRIFENSERSIVNGVSNFNNHVNHLHRTELQIPKPVQNHVEIEPKIISKLDLDEHKLKQKRLDKSLGDDFSGDEENESDNESDSNDDEENKLKYMIVLSKVPPLTLDANHEKTSFLEMLNLTTHKRKSSLEFHKYLKRRKVLGEFASPKYIVECENVNSCDDKENPQINETCNILPDAVASMERNNEVKLHFMSILGLRVQTSPEKQRDDEIIWEGILTERQMRIKQNMCWAKIINNFDKETLHKWLNNLQSLHPNFISDTQNHFNFNGIIPNSNSKYGPNHITSQKQRKVTIFNHVNSKKGSNNADNRSHNSNNQFSSKEFAQEFHESVLQTTKQQLATKQCPQPLQPQLEKQNYYADLSSSSDFKWPGIESVMEAYQKYSIQQNHEKEFLYERSQQLKSRLQDINREAEYLSQKMANLMQVKNQLDEERESHQSSIDILKKYLRQLR